jgi:hypothetical protein
VKQEGPCALPGLCRKRWLERGAGCSSPTGTGPPAPTAEGQLFVVEGPTRMLQPQQLQQQDGVPGLCHKNLPGGQATGGPPELQPNATGDSEWGASRVADTAEQT